MPAGPAEQHLMATRWPQNSPWRDYPSFRRWFIAEHEKLGQPTPDDHVIADEYETRVIELTRYRARCEIERFRIEQREGASRR